MVFNRASCTCSPFSKDGFAAAHKMYERLDDDEFDRARLQQIDDFKSLINFEGCDRFDVFFAPSGSDLLLLPIVVLEINESGRRVLNIVTCPEELGSGSNLAFQGKFYSRENQFGETVTHGEPIGNITDIDGVNFSARDVEGKIIEHRAALLKTIHDKYLSHTVNANLVIGSKSGIENNVSIVSHTPEDVLWTIDLCQYRASRSLINGLIGMGCCVMLTGSKFYQSPPFCAVLLVPKIISRKFRPCRKLRGKRIQSSVLSARHPARISQYSRTPSGLSKLWIADSGGGDGGNESNSRIDPYTVNECINTWNAFIAKRLVNSSCFSLMPGQDETNNSIVAFRVKTDEGRFLDHQELLALYHSICRTETDRLTGATNVLFGQPVQYGDRSFVRTALGSSDIRKFTDNGMNFDNDEVLISLIEEYVKEHH